MTYQEFQKATAELGEEEIRAIVKVIKTIVFMDALNAPSPPAPAPSSEYQKAVALNPSQTF